MVKCSKAEVRRLKTALRWKIPAAQRQRMQMVLLRESGMTQPAIAAAMGVSLSTVNRAHMAYDHGGIEALKPRPNGGRKHENMTSAEEEALLARFAKAAGAGEMLNIHDLKAAYEKAIGHKTSDSTVYNLLHRHGWQRRKRIGLVLIGGGEARTDVLHFGGRDCIAAIAPRAAHIGQNFGDLLIIETGRRRHYALIFDGVDLERTADALKDDADAARFVGEEIFGIGERRKNSGHAHAGERAGRR